jgi:hypothetical protein
VLIWYAVVLSLGAYYVFVTDASSYSKTIISVLLMASFAALFVIPSYWFLVLLLHTAIGIYVIFYLAWNGYFNE